jgi:hypothetical protein
MKRLPPCLIVLAGLVISAPTVHTENLESIEYDIFKRDSLIAVWINLAPFLTAAQVERLKEGIDIALEYRVILSRPRRLWGAEQVERTTSLIRIGYRIVVEGYILSSAESGFEDERHFVSLARLHQFMADSIVIDVAHTDRFDPHRRYEMEIKLACIQLTNLNLASDDRSSDESGSPVKYLFRKFLSFTGFGRKEYSAKSRPFSLSEVTTRDQ